ncbi:MAG TPA: exonuclease [Gammaproteobacteria bacterium]|nr:exonuclease [Gammaproteobacteria bacterium]
MNKPNAQEIYLSTDIEADGPIPGPHSMLSLASAAYAADKTVLATFSVNLEPLPGARPYAKTMAWWEQFPEAWKACRTNPQPPEQAMGDYLAWLKALPGKPLFVGWPAAWDFMWVYWYLMRFTGERPFSECALDIRSYAMGMRRKPYLKCGKNYLPKRWFDEIPHSHIALDDALEQGALFCNMLSENLEGK